MRKWWMVLSLVVVMFMSQAEAGKRRCKMNRCKPVKCQRQRGPIRAVFGVVWNNHPGIRLLTGRNPVPRFLGGDD